jgi:hypothetical protein
VKDTFDIVLYEYRTYSPSMGRWLSRDPMTEASEGTLHVFLHNEPLHSFDLHGLMDASCHQGSWEGRGKGNPFGVEFTPESCLVTLKLGLKFEGTDRAVKEAASYYLIWQNYLLQNYYSGWTLQSVGQCCCCPLGIKVRFDIRFGVTDGSDHGTVNVDRSDARSDMSDWHLGDERFTKRIFGYRGVGHEVGHWFGLDDEYDPLPEDPPRTNPVIPGDEKRSLMGSGYELLPRHMDMITYNADLHAKLPCGPFKIVPGTRR